jgi:biotin carboxyl carrier protein
VRYFVTAEDREFLVEIDEGGVSVDGVPVAAELASLPGTDRRHLRMDDRSLSLFGRMHPDGWLVELEGRGFVVRVEDERARHIRDLASAAAPLESHREVRAPMPGLIVKVEVEIGQEVEQGDGLIVMEAMKMENELRADAGATVMKVMVEPGQTVNRDDLLVVLE